MLNKAKAPAVTVKRMSSSTLFLPPAALSLSGSDWLNIFFPPSARPSVLTWEGRRVEHCFETSLTSYATKTQGKGFVCLELCLYDMA